MKLKKTKQKTNKQTNKQAKKKNELTTAKISQAFIVPNVVAPAGVD